MKTITMPLEEYEKLMYEKLRIEHIGMYISAWNYIIKKIDDKEEEVCRQRGLDNISVENFTSEKSHIYIEGTDWKKRYL